MRKNTLAVLGGLAVMAAWTGPAHGAPTFFYLRADAGGSFPTGGDLDGFDPSPVFGAGIGFSPLPFLRTDVTATYRSQYSGSGAVSGTPFAANSDIKSFVGMVNAYYDFPTFGSVTPYIGGGGGIAHNELGATTISAGGGTVATIGGASKTDFAWQLGAGVAVSVLPTIALDIAYHYLDAGNSRAQVLPAAPCRAGSRHMRSPRASASASSLSLAIAPLSRHCETGEGAPLDRYGGDAPRVH